MKFAVSYSTPVHGADPERLLAVARHAEQLGFEGIHLPEHGPLRPGVTLGDFPLPPTLPYPDPLDCLAFVAAGTTRLLLGTGVLLLPYHHPVLLAKRLATIDRLSRGRMRLLTIGVGALPHEAEAAGVDFASRGRRADEAIDVLRLLWTGGAEGVSFHGEFFDFADLCSFPQPYGGGSLPIHVGGSSRPAARRAGLRGDGWFPGGALPPHERSAQLSLVRSTAAAAGRDPDALEHTRWASVDLTPEGAASYARQGVTRLVVGATDPDRLTAFAARHRLSP